jgi:hypothetical protein
LEIARLVAFRGISRVGIVCANAEATPKIRKEQASIKFFITTYIFFEAV